MEAKLSIPLSNELNNKLQKLELEYEIITQE